MFLFLPRFFYEIDSGHAVCNECFNQTYNVIQCCIVAVKRELDDLSTISLMCNQ